ncbi:PIN domain-containing protein [Streptomyces apocyni]|uniref:PIN domain-containing protein n=1 Tax=Streptomyces apocyni TaxID=2654677 RepID=UPI0012EA5606|nr:PIN domain-containing protein [Streptomyces apocyni]
MSSIAIADTNALYRLLVHSATDNAAHRKAFSAVGHMVISPMVMAELDYLVTTKVGARAAYNALDFLAKGAERRKFSIPDVAPHTRTAMTVLEAYRGADGGRGIGLADAMNVALAAAYRTNVMFTTDRHFRMVRPLTGHEAFRLLPDDM